MMMYIDKIQVPFEDEINQVDRTQTSPKRMDKIDINETYLCTTKKFLIKFFKISHNSALYSYIDNW